MTKKIDEMDCEKCDGKGGYMEETDIEDRSYSSTSSGEFNGPYWAVCNWCNGTGKQKSRQESD